MRERDAAERPGRWELFRLWLRERSDPDPFYSARAAVTIADLPVPVAGRRILDLGCGTGWDAAALRERGGKVVAVDFDPASAGLALAKGTPALAADALELPFGEGVFEVVHCSNMLEHVPSVTGLFDELARVVRPGGWIWLSWTNWYSPYGGHHMSPVHLLGPRLGTKVYYRLFGPPPKNVPGESLFPTYIGRTLGMVEEHPFLELVDAEPRYYPAMRWILRVPGFREFATWNCVMVIRRREAATGSR